MICSSSIYDPIFKQPYRLHNIRYISPSLDVQIQLFSPTIHTTVVKSYVIINKSRISEFSCHQLTNYFTVTRSFFKMSIITVNKLYLSKFYFSMLYS